MRPHCRYRSLGGIAPGLPGYETVKIAPQISRSAGPASANASVATVRGIVASAWTRHAGCAAGGRSAPLLTLQATVPVGMHAEILVPLLGHDAATVSIDAVTAGAALRVWDGGSAELLARPAWLRRAAHVQRGALALDTAAMAEVQFVVRVRC